LRGDEDEEAAARRALAGEHGQKAAVKRPRAAANKEER
jgi:hypothetical protein